MTDRTFLTGLLLSLSVSIVACAAPQTEQDERFDANEDALRAPTAVVELALDANGKCVMKTPPPRVHLDRVVRLKNVGDKPIAALVQLWDNFGGMPAPEGGDIAPGAIYSVKMNTRWWQIESDDSREWSTGIVCKRGLWADDSVDFDDVGEVTVFR